MSDYLDSEKTAQEQGLPPAPPPVWPVSAADRVHAAIRLGYLAGHAGATLPVIQPGFQPVAQPAAVALTPLQRLEIYPQTINAEFLKPMTAQIDAAVAAGNMALLVPFSERIPTEFMVELRRRAAAVQTAPADPASTDPATDPPTGMGDPDPGLTGWETNGGTS